MILLKVQNVSMRNCVMVRSSWLTDNTRTQHATLGACGTVFGGAIRSRPTPPSAPRATSPLDRYKAGRRPPTCLSPAVPGHQRGGCCTPPYAPGSLSNLEEASASFGQSERGLPPTEYLRTCKRWAETYLVLAYKNQPKKGNWLKSLKGLVLS